MLSHGCENGREEGAVRGKHSGWGQSVEGCGWGWSRNGAGLSGNVAKVERKVLTERNNLLHIKYSLQ